MDFSDAIYTILFVLSIFLGICCIVTNFQTRTCSRCGHTIQAKYAGISGAIKAFLDIFLLLLTLYPSRTCPNCQKPISLLPEDENIEDIEKYYQTLETKNIQEILEQPNSMYSLKAIEAMKNTLDKRKAAL